MRPMTFALAAAAMLAVFAGSANAQSFEGRKKCSSCHKSQAQSWGETAHAKAMESLKPNTKAEAKKKAKLDPKKDYTKDKDCVGCHVDGWGKEGGYTIEDPSKFTTGVGCESCHGPGSKYRGIHRKSGAAYEKSKKTTPRQTRADAGQDFKFEESCNACHLNYKGSPWKGAKEPYTPFT
ncbi:MAG TPA: cytochrome c family protein, partial [Verrucomicrobiae bacterium]|nr:cytochrome c family protein [Verrucomicrobiae bacterium]